MASTFFNDPELPKSAAFKVGKVSCQYTVKERYNLGDEMDEYSIELQGGSSAAFHILAEAQKKGRAILAEFDKQHGSYILADVLENTRAGVVKTPVILRIDSHGDVYPHWPSTEKPPKEIPGIFQTLKAQQQVWEEARTEAAAQAESLAALKVTAAGMYNLLPPE